MNVNQLLVILAVLFGIDILLTTISVGFMGAIELNPLMAVFGFEWAMIIKTIISISAIYVFYRCAPRAQRVARYVVTTLVGLYGVVAISNVYQLSKVFV